MLENIVTALPEFILFIGAMGLLMVGSFSDKYTYPIVSWGSVFVLLLASLACFHQTYAVTAFNGSYVVDGYTRFMKVLTFGALAISIVMAQDYFKRADLARFEFPILVLLSAACMGMMISANDLIAMYLGIELQSLALYVLATMNRTSLKSSEAGLKYFVLGALSSGLLLYGCSILYGVSGGITFEEIAKVSGGDDSLNMLQVVGIVFVMAGLAFKVSAVPFHMWTPDVYEGAPTPITALFAAAPKIAGFAVFTRLIFVALPDAISSWQQILIFMSIASMMLGAFSAIGQTNFKRLMAYSSIGHMGFALVGFASGTSEGLSSVAIYIAIYAAMTLGTFACILSLRNDDAMVEKIDDLAGLSRTQPALAAMMAILMFSLAGIPPLAGFFGKFYVFRAAIEAGLYPLAILGVLASVVGAYYYLRIVKIMYLDEPADVKIEPAPAELRWISGVFAAFSLLFFVYPQPLIEFAQAAATALTSAGAQAILSMAL